MPASAVTGGGNRVAILHGAVPPEAPPDDQDTLAQVELAAGALRRLGYAPEPVPVTLDLGAMVRRLEAIDPLIVFNLVESIGGVGRHLYLPAGVMDAIGMPYTGCGTLALFLTTNKVLAKRRMAEAGIDTAPWFEMDGPDGGIGGRMIVKPVWEDASVGIDSGSVVADAAAARRRMAEMHARSGGECFAEAFLDGREFNVAMLELPGRAPDDPLVLPAAELCFIAFPPDLPRIADYAEYWDATSHGYRYTPVRLGIPPADAALVERMKATAAQCWRLFGLRGYARVDFRCDDEGRPFVLEINPNPALSHDTGLSRMLERAGMSFDRAIAAIVESRLRRHEKLRQAG
ncbi:MAG: D-alanine--D-alanine ligase family protein [Rhodospirillales bacterium]